MKSNSRLCSIVDAYSSGQYLAGELKKYGYDCVHVQSTPVIPPNFRPSFRPDDFIDNIIYQGDIEETIEHLSRYNIDFLIVGTESGVELADILAHKMGLPANGIELSKARRNKYEMTEVVRAAGLKAINQIKSSSLDEVVSWVRDRNKWPIVLKPVDSTGTNNVIFCEDEKEVISAFNRIMTSKNVMGRQNGEVLAQEFLEGTEYCVNTVSWEGKHYIAEIWRFRKRITPGAGYIYDAEEPIPYEGSVQKELCDYVCDVLDALDVRFGAAHTEVMMTAEGPILIETGARLVGAIVPGVISQCLGCNQVELTVEAYVEPDKFLARMGQPYSIQKNLLCVSLISSLEGVVKSLSAFEKIRGLPSFAHMSLSIAVGSCIQPTVDIVTSPGIVYLAHQDQDILRQDYETIRSFEDNGLFETQ
ncbi:MAG: Dapdiamide A synthase [Chroococcopsis gigantea SAG 12.99]|jgi:predicted ATP-grasp superfamily ATP-dependent carboligase|nr:Dapdiamide A synthase [Chroococcopsis gigantea SAG 12.99]